MSKLFHICNIITKDQRDLDQIAQIFEKYPVKILNDFNQEDYYDLPTLVVGWNTVKEKFPEQNIFNPIIQQNLEWSFSKQENEKEFTKKIDSFFSKSVTSWLPKDFILYDCFLNNENLFEFFNSNINSQKKLYINFCDGALYVYNDEKNYVINIKSLSCVDKGFKNILTDLLNKYTVVCFSYNNICDYVNLDRLKNVFALDSLIWVKSAVEITDEYFNIIPGIKMGKYIPFMLNKHASISLDFEEEKFYSRMCERDKVTCWLSNREISFSLDLDKPLNFKLRDMCKLAKIHYSNKRTLTGRIVARGDYNPQNLEKNNDDRKKIISRFKEGKIVVFDYISFESKIAMYLSEDPEFIKNYYDKDLHFESACIMFEKPDISSDERNYSKLINHAIIFGAGEELLINRLSERFDDPYNQLAKVKNFLNPIIKRAKEIIENCKINGYMINPWGSIIRVNKVFASFNNYCQTYASEVVVDKIALVKEFLKPYKTQFLFQVHDSMVFDFHPSEMNLIDHFTELFSYHNGMLFNVDYSVGNNYKEIV